jgi:adenosylhomocysteine nucleosidase
MRVLVTFAVEAEFAAWQKRRRFNLFDYEGLKLRKTKIGDADVMVLITGVGAQAASRAMDLMLGMADRDQYFDVCVSSGLAGALCDTLSVGDIVAPKELLAEMQHADVGKDRLAVDAELRERALAQGAKSANCLLTTDHVLVKASQKKSCASRAQSVDMESFEIVKQANAWGGRSVVVRAISDSATEDLPIDFNRALSDRNEVSLGKVFMELMKNPLALAGLIRFGKQSRQAGEALAEFLDKYLEAIGKQQPLPRAEGVSAV